jgi:hypothetical protein
MKIELFDPCKKRFHCFSYTKYKLHIIHLGYILYTPFRVYKCYKYIIYNS